MTLHLLLKTVEIAAALGSLSSIAYYFLCLSSAWIVMRQRKALSVVIRSTFVPPVSILKPLKGADPEMYENFRSHCVQDYPEFEIIFAVSDPDDPAIPLVERLRKEFPDRTIQLLRCPGTLGPNIKVSNLAQMLPHARSEHLVVNDGDIRVPPGYLQQIIAPLSDPQVGMVTCLYRGVAAKTLGSRLESVGIGSDFAPGVLAAHLLEGGLHFALGSTLAFRKRDLQEVGGFEAVVDYLADDYELGRRLSAGGRRVELAATTVETVLPKYSMSGFLAHQVRWARTIRDARPWGYVGLAMTFGLFWSLLVLLLSRGASWAWLLFAITVAARVAAASYVGRSILGSRDLSGLLAWLPVRDLLGVAVWIASLVGRTVIWRGKSFILKKGKIISKA